MDKNLLTSTSQTWATPWPLFNALDQEFSFVLDVAAAIETAKCEKFFTEADDGLSQDWGSWTIFGSAWCNPPYGDKRYPVKAWADKAYRESLTGTTTVMLLPVNKQDQKWFHELAIPFAEIRIVRGRVQFEGSTSSNTQGSMLVIFGPMAKPGKISSFTYGEPNVKV